MDLFEAISTQRTIRRFTGENVTDAEVHAILDAAVKAPSATNCQPWGFVVIRDAATRRALAGIYKRGWELAKGYYGDPAKAKDDAERRMLLATDRLAEGIDVAPVMILCSLDRSRLGPLVTTDFQHVLDPASAFGAVWAAAQNMMLAARALGLATVPTNVHRLLEPEVKQLLGIPANVDTQILLLVGRPAGRFGPPRRDPVEQVAFAEHWGEPWE